jgi:hypothetical protein
MTTPDFDDKGPPREQQSKTRPRRAARTGRCDLQMT